MSWTVHSLGGVDLLWTDPATSLYFVEDVGNPPEEEQNEEYVNLNDGAGARLSKFVIGKAPHTLSIICLGATQADADENFAALEDVVNDALNGDVVTYEYQEDASQPEPTSWRVIGGRVRPRWRTATGEQIFSLAGRAIAIAQVTLNLSRS